MPWPLVSNPEAVVREGGAEDTEIEMTGWLGRQPPRQARWYGIVAPVPLTATALPTEASAVAFAAVQLTTAHTFMS